MNSSHASSDEENAAEQLQLALRDLRAVEGEIADASDIAAVADTAGADKGDRLADNELAEVEAAANALQRFDRLFAQYEDSATGTGDFGSYVQFQQEIAELVEELDEDLPRREAFETTMDVLDQRRLSESDFDRARDALEPVRELQALLERREEAREQYRQARLAAEERREELGGRIDELRRLRELAEVDLDAPVDRLRDPIESYNAAVREDYRAYESEASARELLALFERASTTPLVDARTPPADLLEYVREYPAGTEPVPKLLEFADYSASKLDHYVDDPGALRARVATHRTYLERLSAEPFTVAWPPAPPGELRFRARELLSLARGFADEETAAQLRTVRELPRTTDYERLRTVAVALSELDDEQRERVASGAVERDLERAKERREEIKTALSSAPAL